MTLTWKQKKAIKLLNKGYANCDLEDSGFLPNVDLFPNAKHQPTNSRTDAKTGTEACKRRDTVAKLSSPGMGTTGTWRIFLH